MDTQDFDERIGYTGLKKSLIFGIVVVFIIVSPYFMQFFSMTISGSPRISNVYAQTTPSGSCFPNGPVVLSNSTFWQDLQCVHSGSITINGTGSLTMVNSSLVQEVVNATPSDLNLSDYAQLNLQSSTVNLGGIGALLISGNASASLVTSGLVNSSVVLSNVGILSANESSFLQINGLNSSSISSLTFSNSTVDVSSQSFTFYAGTTVVPVTETGAVYVTGNSSFELTGSTFQASNTSLVDFNTLDALILNSHINNYNVSNFALGNSSLIGAQTTIEDSQVSSALTANVTIGSPEPDSTTEVFSSDLSLSHAYSQNVQLYGTAALTIDNSTVAAQVGSTIEAFGVLYLFGGIVSILGSTISSSTFDYYGYSSVAASNLIINSSLYFQIISSQLLSGQGTQNGLFAVSHLVLNSGANMTVEGTQIESNSQVNNSILVRSSYPPNFIHNMTLTQDSIDSGSNPSNITFSSGYGLLLNRTAITTDPNSTISVDTYQLTSYDSSIPANITVGSSVAFAYLYNTTIDNVTGLKTGTYQNYEWLFVHVLNNASSQGPVAGATVSLIDPNDTAIDYSGQTNSSGWAKISILQAEANSTTSIPSTDYVVQAQSGGLLSDEMYITPNDTSYATLLLNPITGSDSSLNYFSYVLQYTLGVPVSTMGIYTNSYPLNFLNNASFSELDFSTIGAIGTNYTFVLVYPSNFTTVPLSVFVDQVPLKTVKITSNATYYFATFSIPSGSHEVVLSYVSPNSYYLYQQNPILNPGISVIAAVILLLIVGTVFIFYYVKRQNSASQVA
jgi:hypothetical protein